jgi:hypothetical protein
MRENSNKTRSKMSCEKSYSKEKEIRFECTWREQRPHQSRAESRGSVIKLLLYIWKLPGLNLSPMTGYPDWGLSWFFPDPRGKSWDSTLNQSTTASFHIISNSSVNYYPFIRRYMVRFFKKASLNKLQKINNIAVYSDVRGPRAVCIESNQTNQKS